MTKTKTPAKVASSTIAPEGYARRSEGPAQQRAALAVNRELLTLYWQAGRDILDRQQLAGWGAAIVDNCSADMLAAFPR